MGFKAWSPGTVAAAAGAARGPRAPPAHPPSLREHSGGRGAGKTRGSLASDERRVRRLLPQPGRLPCSLSGGHETGWDSANAPATPQGRLYLPGEPGPGPGRIAGPWAPRGEATLAPLPPVPRRPGAPQGCQGHSARRLRGAALASFGQPAGPVRAACTLQCRREASQRETRGCKLNAKFASCSSRLFLLLLLPPPVSNLRRPQG